MGKRTRIVLYALSLVTMLAMVTLIIFSHGRQSGEPAKDALSETDISSTEEPVQIPEAEESEETEAADGQNRIQNDTEQEEADIADDTTLIFAGDVLFANAFKSNYDAGGIEKVIEPQLLQELQDADIFMVNNEFPFSNRGEPMEDKQFTFCCDTKYVKDLNEMGVEMRCLIRLRHWTEPVFCMQEPERLKNAHMNCRLSRKMEKNSDFLRHPAWCRNQTGKWKNGHRGC